MHQIAIKNLNNRTKGPEGLFFKEQCTCNEDLYFSQSQICILLNLPLEDQLTQFQKIELLMAPPGLQDIVYDPNETKNEYVTDGCKTEKNWRSSIKNHKNR